ncbi:MAG: copper chaperone PCu(A)C [Anaerolineales bacterium]|nr:copper chaperone PCu(A)C [Anaerolineales bacterium]MBP6207874.1 copper chaperone PCu(A)C [Anaerolineales bacterium]MBP8165324.1 copper chaperone PCu(A)C [Anaerolineales bacterium]
MKRFFLVMTLAIVLLVSACGAKGTEGTDIETHDAWARSAMKDGNGAAYMLLHNHTEEGDALVGASSDVATATEIHLSQMKADGTMEMLQQESIDMPADFELELKPGSYHIMLIGLKQDLKVGDEIQITLHFKNHEDVTVTVPVMDAASNGGAGMDGHTP